MPPHDFWWSEVKEAKYVYTSVSREKGCKEPMCQALLRSQKNIRYARRQRTLIFAVCLLILALTAWSLFRISVIELRMKEEELAWQQQEREENEIYLKRHAKISACLKRHGSLYAEQVTQAVMATKAPELLAAIAIRESNGNPYALGGRGQSRGAFQIQERWWGAVSPDVYAQARQASKVIDVLLMRHNGNMHKALSDYNNDSSGRYANYVIARMKEML